MIAMATGNPLFKNTKFSRQIKKFLLAKILNSTVYNALQHCKHSSSDI